MNCAYHVGTPGVGFCVNCGRALCASCKRDVEGSVYCEACLSEFVRGKTTSGGAASPSGGGDNPGAAFALGLIPGVGAIYNGEFLKAIAHLVVFGFLLGLSEMNNRGSFEALFVLLASGFYFYMPFEAYYTAKKRQLRNRGIDLETPIDRFNEQLDRLENKELWVGIGLVVLGSLVLMDNFQWLELRTLFALWPALLIAAGVWLVLNHHDGGRRQPKAEAPPTEGEK